MTERDEITASLRLSADRRAAAVLPAEMAK
jgi:hypothetical protein